MKTEVLVNNDINLSPEKFQNVLNLFSNYFEKVIPYSRKVLTKSQVIDFCYNNVIKNVLKYNSFKHVCIINLDKNIIEDKQLDLPVPNLHYRNVNLSRTVNLDSEYVDHYLNFPEGFPRLDNILFVIYDSDIVHGYGISLLQSKIKSIFQVLNLENYYIESTTELYIKEHQELVDLSDLINKGVVLNMDVNVRIPYLYNEKFLNKFVSIPEKNYFEFKTEFFNIINSLEPSVQKRIDAMYQWAKENDRKSFIIGVSGGIDSAVSLALLVQMQKQYPNENFKIIPVIAPIYHSTGTTGQEEAEDLAVLLCNTLEIEPVIKYLGPVSYSKNQHITGFNDKQLIQQSDYWLRPMTFHTIAEMHEKSCMVGTVNHSEWLVGWFSQYLDVFNLMPIVDLFKCEVYELAKHLNIPQNIIESPPSGGLASGLTDEEALGFSYSDIEKHFNITFNNGLYVHLLVAKAHKLSQYKRDRFNSKYIFRIKDIIRSM